MKENKSDKKNNDDLIGYLQLIQEPIGRISNMSAIFKGFAASIFAGFYVFETSVFSGDGVSRNICDFNNILLITLMVAPIILFMLLDVYYLRLERRYRYLYECVATGTHPCNFLIDIPKSKEEIKKADANYCKCFMSTSIWPFYFSMIILQIIVACLKIKGVI